MNIEFASKLCEFTLPREFLVTFTSNTNEFTMTVEADDEQDALSEVRAMILSNGIKIDAGSEVEIIHTVFH